jgi:hypothetical protein
MTNFKIPQVPRSSQSFASPSDTVDVVVITPPSTKVSGKSTIHLKDLPRPLKFDDVARKLIQAGRCHNFRHVCIG